MAASQVAERVRFERLAAAERHLAAIAHGRHAAEVLARSGDGAALSARFGVVALPTSTWLDLPDVGLAPVSVKWNGTTHRSIALVSPGSVHHVRWSASRPERKAFGAVELGVTHLGGTCPVVVSSGVDVAVPGRVETGSLPRRLAIEALRKLVDVGREAQWRLFADVSAQGLAFRAVSGAVMSIRREFPEFDLDAVSRDQFVVQLETVSFGRAVDRWASNPPECDWMRFITTLLRRDAVAAIRKSIGDRNEGVRIRRLLQSRTWESAEQFQAAVNAGRSRRHQLRLETLARLASPALPLRPTVFDDAVQATRIVGLPEVLVRHERLVVAAARLLGESASARLPKVASARRGGRPRATGSPSGISKAGMVVEVARRHVATPDAAEVDRVLPMLPRVDDVDRHAIHTSHVTALHSLDQWLERAEAAFAAAMTTMQAAAVHATQGELARINADKERALHAITLARQTHRERRIEAERDHAETLALADSITAVRSAFLAAIGSLQPGDAQAVTRWLAQLESDVGVLEGLALDRAVLTAILDAPAARQEAIVTDIVDRWHELHRGIAA